MNKQTKTILIVVLALVVVGGVYYGVNRWRQQRLANQILQGVYGVGAGGGLLDKLTGGGNIQAEIAKEIAEEAAKEEAETAAEEAAEAAKTPEDRYNETEEMQTYDANSTAVANDGRDIVEKVFGRTKLTTVSTGMYMGEQAEGSGVLTFKISRLTTGSDLGALNKVFTDRGYQIMQSGIEDGNAGMMAGNDAVIYTVNFDIGSQEVGMLIMKN